MNILIFNCQEKCNTLTKECTIFSTSCISNTWVIQLPIYTQQTPDHTKTVSQPQLEIDFLLDSGAILIVLNNDAWNEAKNITNYN